MTAIDVRGLGKVYKLYQSPMQRLKEIILRRPFHTPFTALDNINFSLLRGETFGIIGENGAGKSTLLKILAKTLKPTSGSVVTNGRTAALLELGAGFNPELTGEENIYLNAYLMGLAKAEIDAKKREIIDFSELGEAIKRAVKTYSSGMYVRLAFSIATSVDPDILIIDEALSVGDQHFQKKCIDRMAEYHRRGKTIIFCSHSLYHVQELCSRAIWLKEGAAHMIGKSERIINEYQNYINEKNAVKPEHDQIDSKGNIQIDEIIIEDKARKKLDLISAFNPVHLRIKIRNSGPPVKGHIGFALMRNDEEICFATATHFDGYKPIMLDKEKECVIIFPFFNLLNGLYYFRAAVLDDTALHTYDVALSSKVAVQNGRRDMGIFFMEHKWQL